MDIRRSVSVSTLAAPGSMGLLSMAAHMLGALAITGLISGGGTDPGDSSARQTITQATFLFFSLSFRPISMSDSLSPSGFGF